MMLLINLSIKFTQYRKHPALGNLCISLGRSAMTKSPQSDDHRDAIDAFQNDGDGRGNQMGGIFCASPHGKAHKMYSLDFLCVL